MPKKKTLLTIFICFVAIEEVVNFAHFLLSKRKNSQDVFRATVTHSLANLVQLIVYLIYGICLRKRKVFLTAFASPALKLWLLSELDPGFPNAFQISDSLVVLGMIFLLADINTSLTVGTHLPCSSAN